MCWSASSDSSRRVTSNYDSLSVASLSKCRFLAYMSLFLIDIIYLTLFPQRCHRVRVRGPSEHRTNDVERARFSKAWWFRTHARQG